MFVYYFGKRKEETKKKGEEISDISKNCVCYPKYIAALYFSLLWMLEI